MVTSRPDAPLALYDWIVGRGEPELWIKDFKRACFADRLSDYRFLGNQFRLLLHAAAYWLLDTLRRWLGRLGVARMQLAFLRLRLLKIGGWVRQHRTQVRLALASSHPSEPLWRSLAARQERRCTAPRVFCFKRARLLFAANRMWDIFRRWVSSTFH